MTIKLVPLRGDYVTESFTKDVMETQVKAQVNFNVDVALMLL